MQGKRVVLYGMIVLCLVVLGVFYFRRSSSIPEVFAIPYRTAVEQEYRLQYEEAGLPIPSKDF
ncbi:hypothetical protein [Streptococcus cuniculi]|uniref:Uncharacterized protein n=1 Tax=Streptococcus cuniculi TaxID=1432788 RepID=A0A4Y9JBT5_9STRE|nr:hypothetical protein [Streptococcus cuniculi]MBF0778773.1 hypothetical protein [Streptococcus cuniculi]TFU97275.1 hypothetical protein E4T82_08585 [Streptococcus cuniculi]